MNQVILAAEASDGNRAEACDPTVIQTRSRPSPFYKDRYVSGSESPLGSGTPASYHRHVMKNYQMLSLLCSLGLSTSAIAGGVPYFVDDDAPPGGDGMSWETAFTHLADAIAAANAEPGLPADIRVAGGTYRPDRTEADPNGSGNRLSSFVITSSMRIRGGFAGRGAIVPDDQNDMLHPTIISGDLLGDDESGGTTADNATRIFEVADLQGASAIFEHLTIRGGNADLPGDDAVNGSALFIDNSELVEVIDCNFDSNRSLAAGGAVVVNNATVMIQGTVFRDNISEDSGGAIAAGLSTVTLDDCGFANNEVTSTGQASGGAVALTGCVTSIDRCQFDGNVARATASSTAQGGALQALLGETVVRGSIFTANEAIGDGGASSAGGAIEAGASTVRILTSRFSGNRAESAANSAVAGAVFGTGTLVFNSVFTGNLVTAGGTAEFDIGVFASIYHCTMADNINDGTGVDAALRIGDSGFVVNSIIWNNGVGTTEADQVSVGTNVVFAHTCIQGFTGSLNGFGNHGLDPQFVDLDGPDNLIGTRDDAVGLAAGSPCVDAGSNSDVPSDVDDLDGDGNVAEPLPLDLDAVARFLDDPDTADSAGGAPPIVDMGAVERQLDCNENGVADLVDLRLTSDRLESGFITPIGSANPVTLVFDVEPGLLFDDVFFEFTASADINSPLEHVDVNFNGSFIGEVFVDGFSDCEVPASAEDLGVGSNVLNPLLEAQPGTITIDLLPTNGVSVNGCGGENWIQFGVSLATSPSADNNSDGIPDECTAGPKGDINGDGAVNFDDLAILLSNWGVCPGPKPCDGDFDGSGEIDFDDLSIILGTWTG